MTRRLPITAARIRMLLAIVEHVRVHQWPPTIRELMTACGVTSSNAVSERLDRLEHDGLIERERGCPRALRLTPAGHAELAASRRSETVAAE